MTGVGYVEGGEELVGQVWMPGVPLGNGLVGEEEEAGGHCVSPGSEGLKLTGGPATVPERYLVHCCTR